MKKIFTLVLTVTIVAHASADAVWHCSKKNESTQISGELNTTTQADEFSIASINSSYAVIGVSIRDLIDIYSGVPVSLGGVPLSACFIPSNEKISSAALISLGLQPSAIQVLSRRSAIVESHIYAAPSIQQMLQWKFGRVA